MSTNYVADCSWQYFLFSVKFGEAIDQASRSAGLSFGAEKVLKKIFGNGYGPNEIKLYKLVPAMTPEQKKAVEKQLVGRGMVRGGGVGWSVDFSECWRPLVCL